MDQNNYGFCVAYVVLSTTSKHLLLPKWQKLCKKCFICANPKIREGF